MKQVVHQRRRCWCQQVWQLLVAAGTCNQALPPLEGRTRLHSVCSEIPSLDLRRLIGCRRSSEKSSPQPRKRQTCSTFLHLPALLSHSKPSQARPSTMGHAAALSLGLLLLLSATASSQGAPAASRPKTGQPQGVGTQAPRRGSIPPPAWHHATRPAGACSCRQLPRFE